MKNLSRSPVTEMLSGRHKIWLLIGLALLPIADFAACITLWTFGAAGAYWGLPFIMTVVDLLYLLGVVLSNQRFKYAQTLFFGYIVITVVLFIVWIAQFAGDSEVILTNTVEAYSGLLHVVGIVAVAISYLYASRRLRVGRHVQLVLAIAFSAVALFALVIVYGTFVISDGYFGQGHGNLPLVYSYVGDDECVVTDVVYGRGDSVVVPYEFNGRKVTGVSAKVFSYANIKSVTLNCDSSVELCADNGATTLNTNIRIYVDKKDADTIRQKLYNRETYGDFYKYRHELGNNVEPIGLDNDEVFVTFRYDRDSYNYARSVIIPTWYGKKGDTFRLSDIEGVDYVTYSDSDSDDDLYYCYNHVGSNGGGFMMSELKTVDYKALDGSIIDASCGVSVSFQRIYKVFTGVSNDGLYKPEEHFSFTTVNGVEQNYKLTVMDKADALLQSFDRGAAFTRTMQYTVFNSNISREFTSLSELLREGYGEVTIAPNWELVAPEVSLLRVNDDGEVAHGGVTYGDDFKLSVSVTHPLDGARIEYEWFGVQTTTEDEKRQKNISQHASSVGIKTYSAIARIIAPEITTCTATSHAEITIDVLKRPLTVKWRMEGGGDVYDGNPRQILNEVENAADGEIVMIMGYTHTGYAGTFTERAEFVNLSQAQNYTIQSGASYTYTIKPRPVALTWDEQTEFEYDAKMYHPTAHAYDLSGTELTINYSGFAWDAGEYTTTATIQNPNYTIDDASQKTMKYVITPKPVTVYWGVERLVYNGDVQAPKATALGVGNETVEINVSGGQRNANVVDGNVTTEYTATAVSANKNYVLTGTTSYNYTIEQYGVTVNWGSTTVTYNGQSRLPTATAMGVKNQIVIATVSIMGATGAVNAGGYTAIATIADTNYKITSGTTHAFTINKMTVSAAWGSTPLIYNGTEQAPTATAKGANGEDLPLTVTGGRRNVGSGTATAAFTTEQQNYVLANTTTTFTIQSKVLNILVNNVTIEYGQTPDYTYEITGKVNGDDVTLTYSANYTLDENGNIPVGEYTMTVTLSGADSGNYQLNVMRNGKLTVTAPPEQTEE